ncbi:MAG: hypothetical protein FWD53_10805 [Phycisphaerales bacterium]|nr:hypothetical protein [Phycisphaerales bacterium]
MNDWMKAICWQCPERIPARVGILPAVWRKYREDLDRLLLRYPDLFPGHEIGKRDYDAPGRDSYREGEHIDAWGCTWSNIQEGMEAIVTGHPVPRREDINRLQPPAVDAGLPHGFFFLRLTDLRGFEEMMLDFAEEPPELDQLIRIVRNYNLGQARKMATKTPNPEGYQYLGDDLGTQHALPISPNAWRKYLKPGYAEVFREFKQADYTIYFHSDGCIWPIIPDLFECGADIVNPQVRANGLDRLEAVCRGRYPIALDLDRQLFPFASPKEIDEHIEECVRRLATPKGGLWLSAEIGMDYPLENIDAICSSLVRHSRRSL